MKDRICFICQRYGLEVNGGAELLCRQLAEHLKSVYNDITVLTSKAVDYISWKNEYKENEEYINGIRVLRFPVTHSREPRIFNEINARFLSGDTFSLSDEADWIEKQGPSVPGLIKYIKDNKNNYDVFIFSTYLYYPTLLGVPEVADKAIVMPNAHDEPYLKFKSVARMFGLPRFFFFNTEEERNLVYSRFHNSNIPSEIGGAGVELPEFVDAFAFRRKYGLDRFLLYVGRIDEGKNCDILFRYFLEYKKRHRNSLELVLMGKNVIPVPDNENIVSLGFVSDEDKFNGIKAADILVLPSRNESLSISVLEAMFLETPVIVNGECEVLKGHCLKSNGALWYTNYYEFEAAVDYIESNPSQREIMTENAKKYVEENYRWDKIISKLSALIEQV